MKKLYSWLFFVPAVLGMMCSTTACSDDDDPEPGPVDPTTDEVTFQVNLADVTATSANVNIVPSNEDATYFATVAESSEITSLTDEQIVAKYVAAEDFATMLHRGNYELTANYIKPETMYTAIVFAYNKGEAGQINKLEFKTGKQAETTEKIAISNLKVGHTDVSLRVTPNSLSTPWYYSIMEKEYYQKYLDQEGEDGPMTHAYYGINNKGVDNGLDIGDYLQIVSMMGMRDITIKDLKQDKEYVLMVFYVNPYQNDPTIIYDSYYAKVEFKTQAADPTQASEVEIIDTNITHDKGMVTIAVTAKATNPVSGKFRLVYRSDFPAEAGWDVNDPQRAYTIATMMGRALSDKQLEELASVNGCTFTWTLAEEDANVPLLFGLYVQNAEGAGEAKAIEIDPTK